MRTLTWSSSSSWCGLRNECRIPTSCPSRWTQESFAWWVTRTTILKESSASSWPRTSSSVPPDTRGSTREVCAFSRRNLRFSSGSARSFSQWIKSYTWPQPRSILHCSNVMKEPALTWKSWSRTRRAPLSGTPSDLKRGQNRPTSTTKIGLISSSM